MRAEPEAAAAAPARRWRSDACAVLSYLVLSLFVLCRLWISPNGRVLSANDDDHGFFLFLIAHGERVIFHGANPFVSDRLNVPDGVNMMAQDVGAGAEPAVRAGHPLVRGRRDGGNAAHPGPGRHRHRLVLGAVPALVRSRVAAWIGGLWCGFCPAMVAHANGHVNFVNQYVVPFLVWQVLRLREPGRIVRGGVAVGLLIVLQVFINEETLLFTALTLGVFVRGVRGDGAAGGARRGAAVPRRAGCGGSGRRRAAGVPAVVPVRRAGQLPRTAVPAGPVRDRPALRRRVRPAVAGRQRRGRPRAQRERDRGQHLLRAAAAGPAGDRGGHAVAVGRGAGRGARRPGAAGRLDGPHGCGRPATTPAYRCRSGWSATFR